MTRIFLLSISVVDDTQALTVFTLLLCDASTWALCSVTHPMPPAIEPGKIWTSTLPTRAIWVKEEGISCLHSTDSKVAQESEHASHHVRNASIYLSFYGALLIRFNHANMWTTIAQRASKPFRIYIAL